MTDTSQTQHSDIAPVFIEEEMRRSYLDYAMSVIVSRALPDVRDGLKPVHRRILYAMKQGGYDAGKPHRKSARVVGDVMGHYHPHGEMAIYDAIVRLAQDFSMRLPLIDGQGNFGSMDGDPAAAMRYTEIRLARAAHAILEDIDEDTVAFQPNYDEATTEPTVLPARFPNLLVNGAGGIAVGMATNIPPHNLGEVIDACNAYLDDPDIELAGLMAIVPGPDFPTGGIILGQAGTRSAYATGHGSVVMRGKTHVEGAGKDRKAIVVTEIPYQVNKARLVERIAEMVREKRIDGVSDLRDESDRDGVRVVIELRRDAIPDLTLNQLHQYTQLQTSFGVNMLALDGGQPKQLNLKQVIAAYLAFREEVVTRRTAFRLKKARERAHILAGLAVAVCNLDAVIALIRAAADPQSARAGLLARAWPAAEVMPFVRLVEEGVAEDATEHRLTEDQAKAILELRLHRLTGLERDKITKDLEGIAAEIQDFIDILRSRSRLIGIVRQELADARAAFATPRRTMIEAQEFETDVEDLIPREDVVVTVSHAGYIKRVPLTSYRAQNRGGKGLTGVTTRGDDFITQVFVVNTHTPVLFFSNLGQVYKLKVYRLPAADRTARGRALVNLLPLAEGETISTVMPLPEDEGTWGALYVMFATAGGSVRRNDLSDFVNVKANGKLAMRLDEGDRLIGVATCDENQDVLLATREGKAIRFALTDVRVFKGRDSDGVRGIRLAPGDSVVSMSLLNHTDASVEERDAYLRLAAGRRRERGEAADGEEGGAPTALAPERFAALEAGEEFVLSVTENGFGKRTSAYEYRITNRGGQGVISIQTSARNGAVVSAFPVAESDQIMLVTNGGQVIRTPVSGISIVGRAAQGVTIFRVADDERVVSVSRLGDGSDAGADEANGNATNGGGAAEAADGSSA